MRRVAGLLHLVHDTVDAITTLVQETQEKSAERVVRGIDALTPVGEAAELVERVRGGVAHGVFESIRLVNRAVEQVGTQALALASATGSAVQAERAASLRLPDAVLALEAGLNAAFGDFLATRNNPLAIEMGLYDRGQRLPLDRAALASRLQQPTGKLAVFVHGLGCNETAFRLYAREHYGDSTTSYATRLQDDLGYTPLFVRYHTGRRISHNGRELASLLEQLCAAYPVPIERLVLIGHSMGGLLSRSAAHYGQLAAADFVAKLSHIVCIGSPHHGAPLEKATNLLAGVLGSIPAAGAEVPAKLLNARSVGVKDLRYGNLRDEDWESLDPDALLTDGRDAVVVPEHVVQVYIAASAARDPNSPVGHVLGDLLVRVPSGKGEHAEPARHIHFQLGEVLYGIHHLALINHPAVYEVLKRELERAVPAV
jgi:pimeloyl-ACP methyl ester carboxylesterase